MNDELFPAEAVTMDSPRLAWMKRHLVYTKFSQGCGEAPWSAWWGQRDPVEFLEYHDSDHDHEAIMGYGATEEAALVDLAIKWQFPLWNEEAAG